MKIKRHLPEDLKLISIVGHYKGPRTANPDTWIEYAASQKSLKDAMVASSLCIKMKIIISTLLLLFTNGRDIQKLRTS